jgi:hypothetical protein
LRRSPQAALELVVIAVLGARSDCCLQKSHSLKPVTTRVLYPGVHRIDIQVNGKCVASAAFTLLV